MKKRLRVQTNPIADSQNIVYFKDYRITVLQNGLFRIEKDGERLFCDFATQKVWYRNMPPQNFTTQVDGECFKIITQTCELDVFENFEDIRIVLNGESKKISNDGNLGGTVRTLDCCKGDEYAFPSNKKGKITLEDGVCSTSGIAFFNDDSLVLSDNGMVCERREQEKDVYVFAYGTDYRAAVNALYLITGKPPVIPRFAFGNWWSRYHDYTEEEYMQVITRFFDRGIPLTVATVDMDWHYSINLDRQKKITESGKNTDYYGGNNGWTGYSWNQELFPDYKSFLKKLKALNLKVTLNLHPSLGIRWFEDCYAEMAKAVGIDPKSEKQIEFDMTDEKFIEAYFDVIHKPYEKDGVDFWWIDWQQGENSKLKGFDPLWALNHYHYLDNGSERKEPLILSRYADIGSHRYPLGFSGDTVISFDTLNYLPYFTAIASNIGYTYWSHDIGGHYGGAKDNELYLRFIQFGVFNPIMRLHGECNPVSTKEPWYYGAEGVIAEKYLRLRHSLIPFLYSYSFVTHRDGYALCEPLYYDYPKDERAYRYKNEYMFGQQLLVIPITSHSEDGYATVKGYLPQGKWTDLFTGQVYDGDKEYEFVRDCESIPVLAKEGAIIPYSEDSGNLCVNPNRLRVDIYDGNSEYVFYEDDVTTRFKVESTADKLRIVVESSACSLKRNVKFALKNIKRGNLNVYRNGVKIEVKKLYADCVSFVLEQFEFGEKYVIEVTKEFQEPLTIKKEEILKKIMKTEGDYSYRQEVYNQVLSSEGVSEVLEVIEKSELSRTIKKYIEDGLL